MRFSQFMIIVMSVCFTASAHSGLYRWVDENGTVHYGDKVPARYLKKAHDELNEQGTMIKKHDRAMTAEERAEKKQQEAEQKRLENERRAQALRDRVLTDTYTTERDLIAARDARLDAIDSQLQLSRDIIASSTEKVQKTEKLIQSIKASGRMVPEATYAKLEREKLQLATQQGVQQGHQIKRKEVIEQFDGYIKRFRELMAEKQKKREAHARRKAERERAARGLTSTAE
ncbi:MAG: DUF4124 domain-containing protein [Gammaproteobacteria bacterium]|nr:DUF4124 domain-containing protein [Gammaproteobacteria bacterium]